MLKSIAIAGVLAGATFARADSWLGYANGPQHSAQSIATSDSLSSIRWSTPVDLNPQLSGGDLFVHYGSPSITSNNTVLVPVKKTATGTTGTGDFEINAINGFTGASNWMLTSDYVLPPHNWIPPFSPTLTPQNRLYYPGASGTVNFITNPDSVTTPTPTNVSFYTGPLDPNIAIDTPLTSDASGDIYFGFRSTTSTTLGFTSGIARIAPTGAATYLNAVTASGTSADDTILMNCAPALSPDGSKLYVAIGGTSDFSTGKLVELNSSTLAPINTVALTDPKSGSPAFIPADGTASPAIGPDGDVYFGVYANTPGSNNSRGWMLHFNSSLAPATGPGAFGWDDTASIVPASMVPSYHGTSSYLIMTKYNNYAGSGTGNGDNKLAILDPNATQTDLISGISTMKEVLTISGVTPDSDHPGGVREWCINTAVVDPATDSVLANSEDGKLYRWDLATNSFSQVITLTAGLGEAYTPTLVGPDGAVYAINDSKLFSVVPEPGSATLLFGGAMLMLARRRASRLS